MISRYDSPFILGRFIKQRSDLSSPNTAPQLHRKAFMPRPKVSCELETSCFEIQGLTHSEVVALADRNNIHSGSDESPGPIYGYGALVESSFPKARLSIDFNNSPERHAGIVGWEPYSKQDRLTFAGILAEASEYHPR